jgi:hypothetical protein
VLAKLARDLALGPSSVSGNPGSPPRFSWTSPPRLLPRPQPRAARLTHVSERCLLPAQPIGASTFMVQVVAEVSSEDIGVADADIQSVAPAKIVLCAAKTGLEQRKTALNMRAMELT